MKGKRRASLPPPLYKAPRRRQGLLHSNSHVTDSN